MNVYVLLHFEHKNDSPVIVKVSWFAVTSSKFELAISWTKFLHNVNNPFLNGLCEFQVDIPKGERVTAVQSLEKLHTFMLRQPC